MLHTEGDCSGNVSETSWRVHELLQVVPHGDRADGRDRGRRLESREQRALAHDACDDAGHPHGRRVRERVVVDRVRERQHPRAEEHDPQRRPAHERGQVALHHVPSSTCKTHEDRVRERRMVCPRRHDLRLDDRLTQRRSGEVASGVLLNRAWSLCRNEVSIVSCDLEATQRQLGHYRQVMGHLVALLEDASEFGGKIRSGSSDKTAALHYGAQTHPLEPQLCLPDRYAERDGELLTHLIFTFINQRTAKALKCSLSYLLRMM